jgi:hypothetical protein
MGDLINTLAARKARIELRLDDHGITDLQITFLEYLNFDDQEFASPYETGCRIFILYALAYTVEEPASLLAVADWLKEEKLWNHLSLTEQEYFAGNFEEEQLHDFIVQMEAAYILAWAVNVIKDKPSPAADLTEAQLENFFKSFPSIGEPVLQFLSGLTFRDTKEIFDENVFYELATAHFRDLLFNDKEDTTNISRIAAFQRHKALNWLRRFSGITDWDETDTST